MRIVIEIDGMQETALSGPPAAGPDAVGAAADDAASDGGAGPAGGAMGSEVAEAAVVTDSGPPPDWLLEAVAAAEAAGGRDAGLGEATGGGDGPGDAGAGPGV
jgi:hypothetical protein